MRADRSNLSISISLKGSSRIFSTPPRSTIEGRLRHTSRSPYCPCKRLETGSTLFWLRRMLSIMVVAARPMA